MEGSFNAKVVLLGTSRVGKTSIATRFGMNTFDENQTATIGVAFLTKSYKFDEGVISFELWDTAGQEKFKSVTMSYVREAKAVLCVYDLFKKGTVSPAIDYAVDAVEKLGESTIIVMVGNKSDLCVDVPPEVYSFCQKHSYNHFECSAKTGEGIDEIFSFLGKQLIEKKFFEKSLIRSFDIQEENGKSKCC